MLFIILSTSSLSHPEASWKGGPGSSPENSLPFVILKLTSWQQLCRWRADATVSQFWQQFRSSQNGNNFAKPGSRLSAAHIRFKHLQEFTD
eukprot:3091312-Pyramimonas_sp.AAC.1